MRAKELFNAGQLGAAIEQLNLDVRTHPTVTEARTFLFELLCFAGDYQRAEHQLDIIARQGVNADIGAQVYRNVLAAERSRRQLFGAGLPPHFLMDPPAYIGLHLEAVNRVRDGHLGEARALLQEATTHHPVLTGKIDDEAFHDWRDSDDLLSPILEVFIQGRYAWLPFAQIKRLQSSPPQRLRDLLWLPTTIEGWKGPIGEVFLPVLYIGSSEHANDLIKLGKASDWESTSEGPVRGVGQRMFIFDGRDRAVLEMRELEFASAAIDT